MGSGTFLRILTDQRGKKLFPEDGAITFSRVTLSKLSFSRGVTLMKRFLVELSLRIMALKENATQNNNTKEYTFQLEDIQ
jgi:hypothetical protein